MRGYWKELITRVTYQAELIINQTRWPVNGDTLHIDFSSVIKR